MRVWRKGLGKRVFVRGDISLAIRYTKKTIKMGM